MTCRYCGKPLDKDIEGRFFSLEMGEQPWFCPVSKSVVLNAHVPEEDTQ